MRWLWENFVFCFFKGEEGLWCGNMYIGERVVIFVGWFCCEIVNFIEAIEEPPFHFFFF